MHMSFFLYLAARCERPSEGNVFIDMGCGGSPQEDVPSAKVSAVQALSTALKNALCEPK